jgi:L-glyceraldehyde 3-phosphate reductase
MRAIARRAFDLGVTHFDLANNYGPPPGSAEETFGLLYKQDFHPYRDELIISTKAGYDMWPGPYGEWGSRKYMLASLDQSLKRMGLDYVDIFYSHRFDPETPLEETMGALDSAVRQGKALYVGISSYNPDQTRRAAQHPARDGDSLPHPPAVLQHVRPLDREWACWMCCSRGDRLHRLLASRAGTADRPLPEGHPVRGARHQDRARLADPGRRESEPAQSTKAQRDRQARGQSLAQMAIAWTCANPWSPLR